MTTTLAAGRHSAVDALGKRARSQLVMLAAEFLLGMGVNLIGLPSEVGGSTKVTTLVLLVAHIGIALGLVIGAVLVVRRAIRLERTLRNRAWIGAALVVVTVTAGVLTMILESNWWSYLMAVGFVGLVIVYGNLLLRTRSA